MKQIQHFSSSSAFPSLMSSKSELEIASDIRHHNEQIFEKTEHGRSLVQGVAER